MTTRTRRGHDRTHSLIFIRAVPVVSGFVSVFMSVALFRSETFLTILGLLSLDFPRCVSRKFPEEPVLEKSEASLENEAWAVQDSNL